MKRSLIIGMFLAAVGVFYAFAQLTPKPLATGDVCIGKELKSGKLTLTWRREDAYPVTSTPDTVQTKIWKEVYASVGGVVVLETNYQATHTPAKVTVEPEVVDWTKPLPMDTMAK